MLKIASTFALIAFFATSAFAAGNSSLKIQPQKQLVTLEADGSASEALASSRPTINDESSAPLEYALQQNSPNPFNPSTIIRYSLPHASKVKLAIYDIKGRQVDLLTNEVQRAGEKSVEWYANNVPAGTYFYRLDAKSVSDPATRFTEVGKMILAR